METLEIETKIRTQEIELYDEDGYSVASLEEGIAEYRAGLAISFKSKKDKMRYIMQELDDV